LEPRFERLEKSGAYAAIARRLRFQLLSVPRWPTPTAMTVLLDRADLFLKRPSGNKPQDPLLRIWRQLVDERTQRRLGKRLCLPSGVTTTFVDRSQASQQATPKAGFDPPIQHAGMLR